MNLTSHLQKYYMAQVLIVEDNRIDACLLEERVRAFGCQVSISYDADISKRIARYHDIIFLDINLPGANGFSVARELTGIGTLKRAGAILMVSSEEFTDEMYYRCLEMRVDGYVQKPMGPRVLEQIFETYIPEKEVAILKEQMPDGKPVGFIHKLGSPVAAEPINHL